MVFVASPVRVGCNIVESISCFEEKSINALLQRTQEVAVTCALIAAIVKF